MAARGSYPHPVLDDASDDVGSSFDVANVTVAPTQEDIELTFDVRSDDPNLRDLIEDGRARHSLRWQCSATIASAELEPQVWRRSADGITSLRTWIDQRSVTGRISAEVRVIAAEPIRGFRWSRQHSDYGDTRFNIEPGDLLADGGSFEFEAEKLFDPLAPPIGSCFEFVVNPKQRRGIEVGLDGDDTVKVSMPTGMFEVLGHLAARPDLQIALVVLPALIETISFIQQEEGRADGEDLSDRAWFIAIRDMADRHGGLDRRPLELAQRILEHPIDLAMRRGLGLEDDE